MIARSRSFESILCPVILAIAALLDVAACRAWAVAYTFIDLYKLEPPNGYSGFDSPDFLHSPVVAIDGNAVGTSYGSGLRHAVVWNGAATPIDLHPPSSTIDSYAYGVGGGKQVGSGNPSGGNEHALLWSGTNAAVDLNPTGFNRSRALGTNGAQQVGFGLGSITTGNNFHGLLWNSTNVAVDLNPVSFVSSFARATDGNWQVGYGSPGLGQPFHALLWHGTNAAIDLHPAGFDEYDASVAYAVAGGQQVGEAHFSASDTTHALLWNGTNVATDLNPPGYTDSTAFGTNGLQQVGAGKSPSNFNVSHALLWNGTNAAIDLGALVPAGFYDTSFAYSIDSAGNVFGLAGYYDNWHAVEWVVVPEPSGLSLLALSTSGLLRRRRIAGV